MKAYSISFSGRVLKRGFWIYIVDVRGPHGRSVYVGRTGDSSSPNASSPFSRIGQHLDLRPKAKGNALLRNLRLAGIDPTVCAIEMIAVGPVFAEQPSFERHRPFRDRAAALEHGLAEALREKGYSVLGKHSARISPDAKLLPKIVALVEARLRRAA